MRHDKPNKSRELTLRAIVKKSDPKKESDWCNNPPDRQHSGIKEDWANDGEYKTPKKVRCPTCNRYLTPKVVSTGCPCCGPYLILPRHKKKHKDRPSNKKPRKVNNDKGVVK